MEWTVVISLVAVGLVLLLVEILFVPGTTIVGVIGFVFLAVGVGLSFRYFGREIGWMTLGVTSVAAGGLIYFAFTTDAWDKLANKNSIDSKVNDGQINKFSVGMVGVTLSVLRPFGKAEFGREVTEVRTLGEYLESNQKIKILRIENNNIFVEQIN